MPRTTLATAEQAPPETRTPLPYPNGWFALCHSASLRRGGVMTVSFHGQDVVVYRTQSGQVRAVRPYCPHLGAHLGYGGRVVGENLVCPFHGYTYGIDGQCIRTGTGHCPPPAAMLLSFHTCETYGNVFIWHHHQGVKPTWELPVCDLSGFSRPATASQVMNGFVQDFPENTCDTVHLRFVHEMDARYALSAPVANGPLLELTMSNFYGLGIEYRVTLHGLGLVLGEGWHRRLGVESKVIATPVAHGPLRWELAQMHVVRLAHPRMAPEFLRHTAASMLAILGLQWGRRVTRNDIDIWNHRIYRARPILTPEDASFLAFRRWSRQFYPEGNESIDEQIAPATISDCR
ncbi:MAG TPA: Rieske 2Fe-2S domain-containing protein [Pararobbsia sp.]|nr:Rieske 2Fe-2S domain-containing protein [Pararobbsia sp.]